MISGEIPANPIERERLAIARNILDDAQEVFKLHRKTCRLCTEITPVSSRWCPEGWEMVKSVRRATTVVTELRKPPKPQADTLF